mmetsp:Transcript_66119/g.193495  ORF Transcript_66119/g.193495 Transcript_66119/m.193495 type:complete len:112 (-) Transcript_66119:133-468(-)
MQGSHVAYGTPQSDMLLRADVGRKILRSAVCLIRSLLRAGRRCAGVGGDVHVGCAPPRSGHCTARLCQAEVTSILAKVRQCSGQPSRCQAGPHAASKKWPVAGAVLMALGS